MDGHQSDQSPYTIESSLIGIKDIIFEQTENETEKFWIVPLIELVHSESGNESHYQITGSQLLIE